MDHRTTVAARQEQFTTEMTQRMLALTQQLCSWMLTADHTLTDVEQLLTRSIKELGVALLNGLCNLLPPRYPDVSLPCPCGALARYQRERPAQVHTLLGSLHLTRPYY